MGSVSSVESNSRSSFFSQYDFNNLPTFASSQTNSTGSKNSNVHHNTSFTTRNTPSSKVELPFLPNRDVPSYVLDEARFPDPTLNRIFSNKATNPMFGKRVWSTNSERSSHGDREDLYNSGLSSSNELMELIQNFGSLIYLLICKGGIWGLWFLNALSKMLLKKVRTIPEPDNSERDENYETVISAESTPIKKDGEDKNIETPLFYQKLRSLNVYDRLREEQAQPLHKAEKVNYKKPKQQYGTQFFKNPSSRMNLETEYLRTALKPLNLPSEDVYSKSQKIKENLCAIYSEVRQNPANPTFTRSTTRFRDLEWLVDDNEDYLNNLERTRRFKEYQNILAERKKMQQIIHLSKLKETGFGVRKLTGDQVAEIEKIWEIQPKDTIIDKFRIKITSRDLLTLCDRHWLNDNIIDFYLQLVKEDVNSRKLNQIHIFSTYFYTTLKEKGYIGVNKWGKRAKVDVSELDMVFVPVNLHQTHWALAVIDNKNERFFYVDSLFGDGTDILYLLMDYMTEETKKNHGSLNRRNYSNYSVIGKYECPTQQNGYDCGVFTCTAADYLSRNRELDYSQADMPDLRRRMGWEILKGKLIEH